MSAAAAAARVYAGRRVLVTGATGFLGRALTRRLLAAGATTTLLARPATAARLEGELAGRAAVHGAAASDAEAVGRVLAEAAPEVVFHLAAFTDPSRDLAVSEAALEANLVATAVLARAASAVGVAAFVATGTCEEYGRAETALAETAPLRPLSPYSAAKAAATLWLEMMHRSHGLPAVILRPFLVYGPGQPPDRLVPAAILDALAGRDFAMTDGRQHRELTYVDDVVDGVLRAGVSAAAVGEVVNLASGEERTVRDIVCEIYRRIGGAGRPRPGALPPRPNEMHRFAADTEKAARLLGWRATTPLAQGLERTIAWARSHGDRPLPLAGEAAR